MILHQACDIISASHTPGWPLPCGEPTKQGIPSMARRTAGMTRGAHGIRFNEHLDEEDGPLVFRHACKLGLEGIVSKRRDSAYASGRSPHWIKSKNPSAPTVKREAEEDWSGAEG
jgi:hypothetical protein